MQKTRILSGSFLCPKAKACPQQPRGWLAVPLKTRVMPLPRLYLELQL